MAQGPIKGFFVGKTLSKAALFTSNNKSNNIAILWKSVGRPVNFDIDFCKHYRC